jgi:hypothetical protein
LFFLPNIVIPKPSFCFPLQGNTFDTEEEKKRFEQKFANVSRYVPGVKNSVPIYLDNHVGLLPFCSTGTLFRKLS